MTFAWVFRKLFVQRDIPFFDDQLFFTWVAFAEQKEKTYEPLLGSQCSDSEFQVSHFADLYTKILILYIQNSCLSWSLYILCLYLKDRSDKHNIQNAEEVFQL